MQLFKKSSDTYKRFNKIRKQFKRNGTPIKTSLGNRDINVIKERDRKSVILTYFDKDNSILFKIESNKYIDDVSILHSKIDEVAIFSAILEIEKIYFNTEYKRDEMLNSLLRMSQSTTCYR